MSSSRRSNSGTSTILTPVGAVGSSVTLRISWGRELAGDDLNDQNTSRECIQLVRVARTGVLLRQRTVLRSPVLNPAEGALISSYVHELLAWHCVCFQGVVTMNMINVDEMQYGMQICSLKYSVICDICVWVSEGQCGSV